jgi:hypothetical protein
MVDLLDIDFMVLYLLYHIFVDLSTCFLNKCELEREILRWGGADDPSKRVYPNPTIGGTP